MHLGADATGTSIEGSLMFKVSHAVLRTIVSLKRDPTASAFYVWLKESLRETDEQNRRATGEALHWGQGKAQAMEEIIKTFDTAEDTLKKLEAMPPMQPERAVPKNW